MLAHRFSANLARRRRPNSLAPLGLGLPLVACRELPAVRDTPGPGPPDLRTTAREVATAILEPPTVDDHPGPVNIVFRQMENHTLRVGLDHRCEDLQVRIRQELMEFSRGKLRFPNVAEMDAHVREGDQQEVDGRPATEQQGLQGMDYLLTGREDEWRESAGAVTQSLQRYSFKLTDVQTNVIVWEDFYEHTTTHPRGSAYQQ